MQSLDIELTLNVVRTVAMIFSLLMLAWAVQCWQRNARRDAQRMFEQLDLIRGELLLLGDRFEQFESRVPYMTSGGTPPVESRASAFTNLPTQAPSPRGYEVAARLARSGATCEELISSCGLSRHEAQLLLRLHGAEAARNKQPADHKPAAASNDARRRLSIVG